MRRNMVLGNWKQNLVQMEVEELLGGLKNFEQELPNEVEVGVIPSFPFIISAKQLLADSSIQVGAQNVSKENNGAYTGEVGSDMLSSVGVKYCLIGHSERRAYFNETNEDLSKKVNQCIDHKICPVFCVGETIEVRQSGDYLSFILDQIKEGLFHLNAQEMAKVVIAYEPVWAIGTGETATPDQAQEVHKAIRGLIKAQYGETIAENMSLLYGGSCKPGNAEVLFQQPDIDGGLIGGASLVANDFIQIAKSF